MPVPKPQTVADEVTRLGRRRSQAPVPGCPHPQAPTDGFLTPASLKTQRPQDRTHPASPFASLREPPSPQQKHWPTSPSHVVPTPEALQPLARGAKQPRVTRSQGDTNPGRVAAPPNPRTAFGVRDDSNTKPRVGAPAPTRGYPLQRLRRTALRVRRSQRLAACPHVARGEIPVPSRQFPDRCHVLIKTCHFADWTPVLLGPSYAPLPGPPGPAPRPPRWGEA